MSWPEHWAAPDKTIVRFIELARGVADDEHPGDEAIPPLWLRESARTLVNTRKLARMIAKAPGRLDLTPELARDLCDEYADEIQILAGQAISDVLGEKIGGRADSRLARCTVEDGALILVLGVLLFEHEHPNTPIAAAYARWAEDEGLEAEDA